MLRTMTVHPFEELMRSTSANSLAAAATSPTSALRLPLLLWLAATSNPDRFERYWKSPAIFEAHLLGTKF